MNLLPSRDDPARVQGRGQTEGPDVFETAAGLHRDRGRRTRWHRDVRGWTGRRQTVRESRWLRGRARWRGRRRAPWGRGGGGDLLEPLDRWFVLSGGLRLEQAHVRRKRRHSQALVRRQVLPHAPRPRLVGGHTAVGELDRLVADLGKALARAQLRLGLVDGGAAGRRLRHGEVQPREAGAIGNLFLLVLEVQVHEEDG